VFLDEVDIFVKAGNGGDGCMSFRREKYIPKGGPDGGNGGDGGSIIFEGNPQKTTLINFKHRRHFRAEDGHHGQGKNKFGRCGEDLVIPVPLGTVIRDAQTGEILADITEAGHRILLFAGGRGGLGNNHFKSSTNRAPRQFTRGKTTEEKRLKLELKLLADVGIIGLPNAGKSTLLSHISHARPKIADYPFTTLEPMLGMVHVGEYQSFVAADIPGLIEGAHKGSGLGDKFLRHIERTKVLIHLIDVSDSTHETASKKPDRSTPDAYANLKTINRELKEYSPALADKPQIVALNKIDAAADLKSVEKLKKKIEKKYPVFLISAATGKGLKELLEEAAGLINFSAGNP
jgi:GTP-binding protein